MSNLEPIEESDINLKEKFLGGISPKNEASANVEANSKIEIPAQRKEGVVEKEQAYTKILSKIGQNNHPQLADDDIKTDADVANSAMDAESKINKLINLAETKGIYHAVKVARHMEDNYTLDEFHDRLLAEELHEALLKKGLIKEI